jgi:hypothetical protein
VVYVWSLSTIDDVLECRVGKGRFLAVSTNSNYLVGTLRFAHPTSSTALPIFLSKLACSLSQIAPNDI